MQPVAFEGLATFGRGECPRYRCGGLHIRGDRLVNPRPLLNPRASLQNHLDPAGRETGRLALCLELLELPADRFGFFPLAAVVGLQPVPLPLGQRFVFQGHFQQALGGLRHGCVVRRDQIARRIGPGPRHEVRIVVGKIGSQSGGDNRGEFRV